MAFKVSLKRLISVKPFGTLWSVPSSIGVLSCKNHSLELLAPLFRLLFFQAAARTAAPIPSEMNHIA
jgi:hypothetical protein